MKPNQLRNFAYSVGILFLFWHTFVLVLYPMPNSYIRKSVIPYVLPYVEMFHLNNNWNFYTPDPAFGGSLVRYKIIGNDYSIHSYKPIEDMSKLNPSYFRYTTLHSVLIHFGKSRINSSYANYLCRKHRALNPIAVEFAVVKQLGISTENYLNGIRPLDHRYISTQNFNPVDCP